MIARYSRAARSSALELAVGDPDDSGEQLVERREVPVAEHLLPDVAERVEDGRVEDAVVGARLQVHGRAAGHVAGQRPAGGRRGRAAAPANAGRITSIDGGFERAADEPAAERAGRVLADAVGFHARLLEQPPVDRELPVVRVV